MEFSVTPDHCRVCLKRTPTGKSFRDKFALELPSTTGIAETRSYLDIYQLITTTVSLPPSSATFFPQRICDNCEAQLLVAYEFRRKSVRSERVLLNILNFYEDEQPSGGAEEISNTRVKPVAEEPDCSESGAGFEEPKESVVDALDSTAVKEVGAEVNFPQFEHDYEFVTDGGLEQEEEIGYIIEEEFMDDGEESESNEEDEFYEVQLAESKTKTSLCPDCGKVVSARYLEKHREVHKDKCDRVKPFECDLCQARFTLKENLLKHKRIHSNEKKYSCPFCEQQFLHWASRRYHIDSSHTGEKRFTCEYCGAKFRNSSHYSVHLRRHKGLTPFPCHLCDRSFITGSSLKLHLASHSDLKNFSCELCKKTYKTGKSLRIHKRTAHEREKNYVCPVCSRAYSQNHVLKTHLLRHHPHYEPPPPGTVINVRAVRKMNEQLVTIGCTTMRRPPLSNQPQPTSTLLQPAAAARFRRESAAALLVHFADLLQPAAVLVPNDNQYQPTDRQTVFFHDEHHQLRRRRRCPNSVLFGFSIGTDGLSRARSPSTRTFEAFINRFVILECGF